MVACELTTQAGGRRLAAIARKPWRQPCKPRGCIASVRRAIFDAATLWALGEIVVPPMPYKHYTTDAAYVAELRKDFASPPASWR